MEYMNPKDIQGFDLEIGDKVAYPSANRLVIGTVTKIKNRLDFNNKPLEPRITVKAILDSNRYYQKGIEAGKALSRGIEPIRVIKL